jgi:peptide deformylase
MVIRKVTQVGNPIIRRVSKSTPAFTSKKVKKVVRDLVDSMRHHGLIGMAAPQIAVNLRAFVTEIRKTKTRNSGEIEPVRIFLNPKILSYSKNKDIGYEGCGSVASSGLFGRVKRARSVDVEAFGMNGKKFKLRASGLLARIIQHELDHLNGQIFLDKLHDSRSLMSRSEYIKHKKKIRKI